MMVDVRAMIEEIALKKIKKTRQANGDESNLFILKLFNFMNVKSCIFDPAAIQRTADRGEKMRCKN